jgi:hypothetical protein
LCSILSMVVRGSSTGLNRFVETQRPHVPVRKVIRDRSGRSQSNPESMQPGFWPWLGGCDGAQGPAISA